MPRLALLALTLAASTASAQDVDRSRPRIDALVAPLIEAGVVRGVGLGIVQNGQTWSRGFGTRSASDPRPPDERTLFEIGSVSKAFTGVLLADMVVRGEVKLEAPVSTLLPDGVKVPQQGERAITLLDLTTHTSGLPRMPNNFVPRDPKNPYADYTAKQLYAFLSSHTLARRPGAKYAYSNLGAGLLGHALARRAGMSYEALLRERIAVPLGMTDTVVTLKKGARLIQGHDRDGEAASRWDLPAFAGAGGIRSTVADMLKFLRANLGPGGGLKDALAMARKQRHVYAPGRGAIGLGWHLQLKQGVVSHSGMTGGYASCFAFDRARRIGVVVLGNAAVGQINTLGFRALAVLRGEKVQPFKVKKPVRIAPAILQRYVGTYELAPTFHLVVTRVKQKLFVQATRQQRFRVFPRSKTEFVYRVVKARISFQFDAAGKVTGLTLHQGGRNMPAKRVE